MLRFEQEAWSAGSLRVAGVDEAGRGPLAGPVVAAAVVFEKDFLETEASRSLAGINDSKKLPASRRKFFYDLLSACPHVQIGIASASVQEIDSLNILRATHLAMARAVGQLSPPPELALVDGLPVKGLPVPHRAIVGGDARSRSIASAVSDFAEMCARRPSGSLSPAAAVTVNKKTKRTDNVCFMILSWYTKK